jgi:arabinogalactan endo-1,4-beta-galactosidase
VAGRKYENWPGCTITKQGYEVKAIDPKIKVIVHLDGNNNAKFRWFFDSAKANKVKYDVIGLSYYPFGLKRLYRDDSRFREQFKDMASRYNKVMVVEVGWRLRTLIKC